MKLITPDFHVDGDQAIRWQDDALYLLDQRLLPAKIRYVVCKSSADVAEAIQLMVVRGAPAIGITAAYGAVLAARECNDTTGLEKMLQHLASSRPTAVNLIWAINRVRGIAGEYEYAELEVRFLDLAQEIHRQDIADNQAMGQLGATLIESGSSVLTHCNAGALATGGYGTALGVIRAGWQLQHINKVFADETRPWLQGTRLTAWELARDNIPVQVLVDGAAAALMAGGNVQWVIVGSDRIAANGDVANKIGTYSLAVAARYHGVKFMVVAPTSTIDMASASGEQIPIEHRSGTELFSEPAGEGVDAWNPVFDVTPAKLVDVLVTEKGVVHAPDTDKLEKLMA